MGLISPSVTGTARAYLKSRRLGLLTASPTPRRGLLKLGVRTKPRETAQLCFLARHNYGSSDTLYVSTQSGFFFGSAKNLHEKCWKPPPAIAPIARDPAGDPTVLGDSGACGPRAIAERSSAPAKHRASGAMWELHWVNAYAPASRKWMMS